MATFRKDKQSGEWKVFGPASEVKPGPVTVRKADGGTKLVTVISVSRSFDVDGVPHVYGFLANDKPEADSQGQSRGGHGPCAECGQAPGVVLRHDSSGIGGYCCPRCARMSRYELSFA